MSAVEELKSQLSNVQGTSDSRTSDSTDTTDKTPEPRPLTPGPGSTGDDKGRTELAKKQLRDLKPTMVQNSVNKTALHPAGVEYVFSTTKTG